VTPGVVQLCIYIYLHQPNPLNFQGSVENPRFRDETRGFCFLSFSGFSHILLQPAPTFLDPFRFHPRVHQQDLVEAWLALEERAMNESSPKCDKLQPTFLGS